MRLSPSEIQGTFRHRTKAQKVGSPSPTPKISPKSQPLLPDINKPQDSSSQNNAYFFFCWFAVSSIPRPHVLPKGSALIYRFCHPNTMTPNLSVQPGSLSGAPDLSEEMPTNTSLVFREMQIKTEMIYHHIPL